MVDFNHDNSRQAEIYIHHPAFYRKILFGGSIAAGESYVEGDWDSPDVTRVIRLFARNSEWLLAFERRFTWLTWFHNRIQHVLRYNSKKQVKRNILAHYDLGNILYQHFLDRELVYSCAVFPHPDATLEEAQQHKMHLLCEKLKLRSEDHLLEIGTGWGALAIYAAKNYGCFVTTTTISEEQYRYAQQQVQKLGLQDRITLLKKDYRELTGQYDKLVSVEMIEAVGQQYLPQFFSCCNQLLKEQGRMALQAIVVADRYFDIYSRNVDFAQKYIFPGGFLPTLDLICLHVREHTDLIMRNIEDIGSNYAKTLSLWWNNFNTNKAVLLQHGYDERFARLWRYYLNYCEGGFCEGNISAVQFVASKRG